MKNEIYIDLEEKIRNIFPSATWTDINNTMKAVINANIEDNKYNGYTNYETWLFCLIIDNNQYLTNLVLDTAITFFKSRKQPYQLGKHLKEFFEEHYTINEHQIIRIDCESWTFRDYQEINFIEVGQHYLTDAKETLEYRKNQNANK